MTEVAHKLNEAPLEVQVAIDLIQLLEENNIDNNIAIKALEIVLNDFQKKAHANCHALQEY